MMLVVAGCVAQAEGAEILRRQPAVDVVVGPQSYHRLPQLLREARIRPGVVDTEFPAEDKFSRLPAPPADAIRRRGVTAFVTVQEGCDKFCSFCVVPYTRGAEASRPSPTFSTRSRALPMRACARSPCSARTSTPIMGSSARGQAIGLAGLIRAAASVPGIRRVRYMTSHPNDMSEDLIQAHRDVPALAPYLHLPVQSGSDSVLKSMNRRHRVADYLDVVARVRAARPDIAFSSDFIVGYPGETDADFDQTLALVRAVGFASSYAFKYSPRPGTPAAEMSGQVDEATKARRLAVLQDLIEDQRQTFNRASVGQRLEVLFEKAGRQRGPAHRTVADHAIRVRRGAAVADRRTDAGRDGRRRAAFAAWAHCLASVVNRGLTGVRDDSEPEQDTTERTNLKPQDTSPSRIAAAPPVITSDASRIETCRTLHCFPR